MTRSPLRRPDVFCRRERILPLRILRGGARLRSFGFRRTGTARPSLLRPPFFSIMTRSPLRRPDVFCRRERIPPLRILRGGARLRSSGFRRTGTARPASRWIRKVADQDQRVLAGVAVIVPAAGEEAESVFPVQGKGRQISGAHFQKDAENAGAPPGVQGGAEQCIAVSTAPAGRVDGYAFNLHLRCQNAPGQGAGKIFGQKQDGAGTLPVRTERPLGPGIGKAKGFQRGDPDKILRRCLPHPDRLSLHRPQS